jgi:uncharacterized protein (DUF2252 family)
MPASAASSIEAFNADREPERRAMKIAIMGTNAFSFLRGTAHLFWQRMQEAKVPTTAPPAWCSGDLHLENFGTYHGDNGLAYFDLNDFDEGALAPCDWEILRFLTSIFVAAPTLNLNKTEAKEFAKIVADAYRAELIAGKALWIERKTATGAVDDLMRGLKKRTQVRLLNGRTITKKGERRLDLDNGKMLPASGTQRTMVEKAIKAFGKAQGAETFFTPLDCARRIAGTSSLGVQRFVVLIEGNGSPDGNLLIDLKATVPPSLAIAAGIPQPAWANEAARIVAIQHRCQAISPALLTPVNLDGGSYVLKELQPSADRLDLARIADDHAALADVLKTMAQLTAWAQLRSTGRDGSASKDDLIAYARGSTGLANQLVATARDMAAVTLADYASYVSTQPSLKKAAQKGART